MNSSKNTTDTVIIGGGAAGLMCAITAAGFGRSVTILEHNKEPGAKILISGGGRCNFTNTGTDTHAFISENPLFAKSALNRYKPQDIIAFLERRNLSWREKKLGQLFCEQKARALVDALIGEATSLGVDIRCGISVHELEKTGLGFEIKTNAGPLSANAVVIASGGLSIPKLGASDLAYRTARKFDIPVVPTRPALVPLTFSGTLREAAAALAGTSQYARVYAGDAQFDENLLFTHRGLSGPAILQASSYWREGAPLRIDLTPDTDGLDEWLKTSRKEHPSRAPSNQLATILPSRLAKDIARELNLPLRISELSNAAIATLKARLKDWQVTPSGSEGYAKAEVTAGGIATDALNQRSMESRAVPGLYFIGECVDMTGWLGGYNFQWAWASGYSAGSALGGM